jgi:hypothetical protein
MFRTGIGLFLAIVLANIAAAGPLEKMTGKQLLSYCSDYKGDSAQNLFCGAYIAGFADGLVMGEPLGLTATEGRVCLPRAPIDGVELRRFLMRANPEILDQPARLVLGAILWDAFPCGKK